MQMTIFYITISFISLVYLLIGIGINEKNAKYLLAGYNTASEDFKKNFNLKKYLLFFKSFFIRVSLFPWLSWLFSSLLIKPDPTKLLVWSSLQIIPFIYLIKKSTEKIWNN